MKTSDNKGFTLVEVIIAVMVLAVVIVPLFHSFVSSHRINGKSKQYMRATTLAQDEMEIFERQKIADLIDPTKFTYVGEDGNPPQPDDSDGRYVFIRKDINNDSSGSSSSKFDVVVTLDPERDNDTDRYFNTNTQELFYMNSIASSDSAVHVQAVRSASNLKSYDDTIYEYFDANKSPVGAGSSWDAKKFNENLARKIKVRIYQENNGLNIATIVKVTYEYLLCNNVVGGTKVMPDGYEFYSEESIIFNNSAQSVGDDGNLPELKSVYLFYAPRYWDSSMPHLDGTYILDGKAHTYKTYEDCIVIENEAKLPVDVYVVRLDTFKAGSTTEIEPVPNTYQPRLEIYDGIGADDHTIGNYFTNLNIDEPILTGVDPTNGKPIGNGRPMDLSGLKDYGNISRTFSNAEALSVIDPKHLSGEGSAQAQGKDRIYTMTVEVYVHEEDKILPAARPLVTMTGSKLE